MRSVAAWRVGLASLGLLALLIGGCEEPRTAKPKKKTVAKKTTKGPTKKVAEKPAGKTPRPRYSEPIPELPTPSFGPNNNFTSSGNSSTGSFAGARAPEAGPYLMKVLNSTVEYGPTLIVWIIDKTDSAQAVRQEATGIVRDFYGAKASADAKSVLSAVVTYGEKVDDLPEPTADNLAVIQSVSAIPRDESVTESTFTALRTAVDQYAKFRTQDRREVVFILVTDEIGDDHGELEPAVALCRKHIMPVYVIGVTAPLGKTAYPDTRAEMKNDKPMVTVGPESREVEMVQIESLAGGADFEFGDSGFGPYWLEYVARATEGKFLGIPGSAYSASKFDPAVMKKYAPDYLSEADYQKLMNNAAAKALVNAGKLPRAEVRKQLNLQFAKTNEAQMARTLGMAQQGAAKLEPAIDKIYEALVAGEGDRAKLTSPRLQAGYDVAMGRACAAKARIEGYNAMLAQLKQGKAFTKPGSSAWQLQPAATSDAGSSIAKLVERSQMYLKRVVEQHPGTPWAMIAEKEMTEQVGWKWEEK